MSVTKTVPTMPTLPLHVTEKEMKEMHQAALEVIATIGLEVRDEKWREKLKKAGGTLSANRVMFSPEMVDEYLREWREQFHIPEPGWAPAPEPQPRPESIRGTVYGGYIQHLDLETGEMRNTTTADSIKYIQFINNFEGENLDPGPPGLSNDVPGIMQPMMAYKLSAQYSPSTGGFGWLSPPKAAEYMFRMGDLMGEQHDRIMVFNVTPLRLGGVQLDTVLAFPERFKSVCVSTCIVAGSVGPIYPKASAALGIAENIAAMIAVRILTGLPTDWVLRVDAFDMRSTLTVYGSPEMTLFHRMSEEVNSYYRGTFPMGGAANLMTMAKVPGIQAAMDKAAAAGWAAAYGCNHFLALGTIFLEQVFSPEQLVIDLEIRDWAQRLLRGVDERNERPEHWVEMIRQGIDNNSTYVSSDWTLDHYQEVYWLPKLIERSFPGALPGDPEVRFREKAKRLARERMTEHPYRLAEPKWSQLEEIYEEARKALCPDTISL